MLRLTGTERGVAEVAAVAEHVASLTATAAAFDLMPDVPHVTPDAHATVPLLDDCGTSVSVAGSCNAVLRRTDGTLYGELFDGAGFVRCD